LAESIALEAFKSAPGLLEARLQLSSGLVRHARTLHFSQEAIMALERTFSILKPDATRRNLTGAVNAMIEAAGLRIVAQKRIHMTRAQAETFYGVHKERPFFGELVDFMTSAPVVVQVLEGDNAIQVYRDVMGATNPANAADGTIRKVHAVSVGENTVHGSDAPETAAQEIAQFFSGNEIVG
jgi:nucleoside-diphosphate kinase